MLRNSLGLPAAALALSLGVSTAATARAAVTDRLTVSATVTSGCALSGGNLNFGQYLSGQSGDLDATGTIAYANCSGNLTVELDGGTSGSTSSRQMSSGSSKLRYQLYKNSTRTTTWGTGTDAFGLQLLSTLSGNVTVYGRIAGGQAVSPGTYNDVVNITLTF